MSFGQGLSGLKAASQTLDVIGNNIANSGTVGFKAGTATFADVYASSRVGLGTQVASINQRFTIGTISGTGNQFDMAIDGEKGLFRLLDTSGAVMYSRNGQFGPDKSGYLVNAQGQQLTGYLKDIKTGITGATPEPISVPSGNIAPKATGTDTINPGVKAKVNLDSGEKVPTVAFPGPPPPTPAVHTSPDPKSYNHALPLTVYDSLGSAHRLTQYFAKTADNRWSVHYQLDDQALTTPPSTPFSLTFTDAGVLPDPPPSSVNVSFNPGGGAEPLNFKVDYANSTQFAGNFAHTTGQDGYPTGEYASMSVASDGSIVASYTNGKTLELGKLVLADFANLQGLQPVGGNAWIETSTSGPAILDVPGANGLASIKGQAVEESNVDMSQELVNMIIAQRTYQANAQTIKTQDQIMQTLISMR